MLDLQCDVDQTYSDLVVYLASGSSPWLCFTKFISLAYAGTIKKHKKNLYNAVTKTWQVSSSKQDEVPLFKDSSDEETLPGSSEEPGIWYCHLMKLLG